MNTGRINFVPRAMTICEPSFAPRPWPTPIVSPAEKTSRPPKRYGTLVSYGPVHALSGWHGCHPLRQAWMPDATSFAFLQLSFSGSLPAAAHPDPSQRRGGMDLERAINPKTPRGANAAQKDGRAKGRPR